MKKLRMLVLIIVMPMLLVLAACGSNTSKVVTLDSAKMQTASVESGSGNTIGERAYIEIPKIEFEAITPESLYKWADKNVKEKTYNWVTIISDDGQGIQFVGSDSRLATKGKIDSEGIVTEQLGMYLAEENTYEYIED